MMQRCHEDDGFEETVAMLEAEHESDHELHDRLVPALRVLAGGASVENHAVFARDAVSFSTLQRRHLAWENGAVLPLARRCLSKEDLEVMAASMTKRRSVR
jgi:hemerythrin-like domain-containing protein